MGKRRFRIDVELPPAGPARWGTIAMLVAGGVVAVLVPLFLVALLWDLLVR